MVGEVASLMFSGGAASLRLLLRRSSGEGDGIVSACSGDRDGLGRVDNFSGDGIDGFGGRLGVWAAGGDYDDGKVGGSVDGVEHNGGGSAEGVDYNGGTVGRSVQA